jgi:hypothetical protein
MHQPLPTFTTCNLSSFASDDFHWLTTPTQHNVASNHIDRMHHDGELYGAAEIIVDAAIGNALRGFHIVALSLA